MTAASFLEAHASRESLLRKLMAFAQEHPERAAWAGEAIAYLTFEEIYPLRAQLWHLQELHEQV